MSATPAAMHGRCMLLLLVHWLTCDQCMACATCADAHMQLLQDYPGL